MTDNSFTLKNSSKHFNERQKNIFDQLNKLQCNLRNEGEMDVDVAPDMKKPDRSITKQFRGKESIFKRPQDPVRKNYLKTIPDFKKNPHKWKKYSLADVKDEDMSDKSNTKAALSFLNELKSRNNHEVKSDRAEESRKIVFKKVPSVGSAINVLNTDDEVKPTFKSSKVIMPEYVVGEKVKKEKKNRNLKSSAIVQLKLDHLHEND
ncbi:U5 small nuclear ribonucleoprotein TSSC4 [Tenebrio molitor]|jgi:hypothetical protein|uniref:U5 small nuclear ribonucleoprotein TSSC4 n=1 Tax=Tenebrio molitor TaxID=7067 RepID=UPI001C3A34C7|nr:unnamed protein product [Tenebrio molitor]